MVSAGFFFVPVLVLAAAFQLVLALEGPKGLRRRTLTIAAGCLAAAAVLGAGTVLVDRHQSAPAAPVSTTTAPVT